MFSPLFAFTRIVELIYQKHFRRIDRMTGNWTPFDVERCVPTFPAVDVLVILVEPEHSPTPRAAA